MLLWKEAEKLSVETESAEVVLKIRSLMLRLDVERCRGQFAESIVETPPD